VDLSIRSLGVNPIAFVLAAIVPGPVPGNNGCLSVLLLAIAVCYTGTQGRQALPAGGIPRDDGDDFSSRLRPAASI